MQFVKIIKYTRTLYVFSDNTTFDLIIFSSSINEIKCVLIIYGLSIINYNIYLGNYYFKYNFMLLLLILHIWGLPKGIKLTSENQK